MAVGQTMHIARHTGSAVVLVHAGDVDGVVEIADSLQSSVEELERMVQDGAKLHQSELEHLRTRLAGQGVELSHALVGGYPDEAICEAAKINQAKALLLGE